MWEILLFFLFIVPAVHLIHEMGHVLFAKLFGIKETEIVLGIGPEWFHFSHASIRYRVHYLVFLGGYSTNSREGVLSPEKVAFISLGGPLFNIASIFLVLPLLSEYDLLLLHLFILFSSWVGLVNLIPFKMGNRRSDGWQIATSLYRLVKIRRNDG